jgi:hypothetical protein
MTLVREILAHIDIDSAGRKYPCTVEEATRGIEVWIAVWCFQVFDRSYWIP